MSMAELPELGRQSKPAPSFDRGAELMAQFAFQQLAVRIAR
jgi:hypothetical protein